MKTLHPRRFRSAKAPLLAALCAAGLASALRAQETPEVPMPDALALGRQPVVFQVDKAHQRLDMVVNTSRILTLDVRVPRAQVNNPEVVKLVPLSPTQIQVSALKAGVTQINLWDEKQQVHAIDVMIIGDAQELQAILQSEFPSSNLRVRPLANSVIISGQVDRADVVTQVMEIAQDYYPKVINNIRVGGVQQVVLHLKVMEVSRTKLRSLGIDWLQQNGIGGAFVGSGITGVLRSVGGGLPLPSGGETFAAAMVSGNSKFFMLLDAMRQNNLAKVLAEPDLVTNSGRPAFFNVGGEFPILVPQSLGTVSVEYKKFGTQIDFVPIVMGNAQIRLEVRPRVSEIDSSRSVRINDVEVPGLRVREVDTGVTMRAGQTLAIAGLVQTRVEALNRGIPYMSDLPYVGAMFRKVQEESNEIELLILVTPEIVDALECEDVPPGGPGTSTASPCDWDLYWKGYLEVPKCAPGGAPHAAGDWQQGPAGAGGLQYEHVPSPQPQGELPAPNARRTRPQASPASSSRQPPGYGAGATPAARPSGASPAIGPRPQLRRSPYAPSAAAEKSAPESGSGFIGPVGYDVRN